MIARIGTVTNTDGEKGCVRVQYEDTDNASRWLPVLTMNNELAMPAVGEQVLVIHLPNGQSKGIVIGTYYCDGNRPKTSTGYRKDFENGAFAECQNGILKISAKNIILATDAGEISIADILGPAQA